MSYPISRTLEQWRGTEDVNRSTYRIFCVLAGLLNPLFGLVYHATDPSVIDPLWARLVLSVLGLLLLSLSYMVREVEERFIGLVQTYFYLLIVYVAVITAANSFSPNYALGLLFTFTVMGVAFSLGLKRALAPLRNYLLFTVVLTVVGALVVSAPQVNIWILGACVISTALVIYVVAAARIQTEETAESSENRYHTLMHAANDAIFIADADEGQFVDANQKALELLGRTPEEMRGLDVGALFPESERERYLALLEDHVFNKKPIMESLQVVTRGGQLIPVDLGASLIEVNGHRYIQSIVRDATERQRFEDQLIQAKERTEELLRIKTSLLNNMSHELRTPLTAILGFSEVLIEEVEGASREHAELVHSGATRLYETVNSVLGLAQLESGAPVLGYEPVEVVHRLRDCVTLLEPLARTKGLTLRMANRSGPVWILGDGAALSRLAHNLVGNAIKFTSEGEVELEVSATPDRIIFRVRDTGVGIAGAFLPQLFEEFQQESTGLARSHEGSGLGLAISKRLVDLMDGTIEVESEKGRGSIFTVSFPRISGEEIDRVEEGTPAQPVWVSGSRLRQVAAQ